MPEWKHKERCERNTQLSPQFYNENANKLAEQYLSKSFEQAHQSWSGFVPSVIKNSQARILDIYCSIPFVRQLKIDLFEVLVIQRIRSKI